MTTHIPSVRTLLDYDAEAEAYDATRGGTPRAEAAAAAVLGLLPAHARTLLDLGCGTGIVTSRLRRPALRVLGADASHGMAATALRRGVPVALADAARLPVRSQSLDAVSAVWLLHLLREPGLVPAVIAEAARVLRPGGVLLATVDKDSAHDVGSDIDAVFAAHLTPTPADASGEVEAYAARAGLLPVGEARFTGHGQGRTPRGSAEALLAGRYASRIVPRGITAQELAARLELLPDQDVPRAEPTYRIRSFVRV
ncbi:class I SAM-dependent methyltransferase [Streptomyces avidinii]|uniref:Ubiquinone/menaquinone biosynthesis C-methylase UbiE n=1 Tax=Streptomyces avidinii TaxID=1895 RepID=A0ABS4L2C9_STRAV|nr:class I SAM-dependent methyltransferase [Streptomyces avidinii]MBP2035751.1 ubiquinone/menaquinone biosynthesis C-methylase UbiE [Streptomyces avidinii]GGY99898.1 methyltransferase [Streptomyces avidinii]